MIGIIIVTLYLGYGIYCGVLALNDSSPEDKSSGMYLIGILLAVLIWPIAGILYYILERKKSNKEEA